jgi:peptide/nickel transport system permease protein
MAMIPGDPATAILGSFATPENVAALNEDLGLDKPLVQRYFIWLGNMLQGDFGRSFALNRPVLDEVMERFNATLVLAGTSFVLCSVLGIAAGVDLGGQPVRARRQGDHLRRAARYLNPVLLPRHDDDPHLRGEPALVPGLGHVAHLRRRGTSGSCSTTSPCRPRAAVVATGVIARLSRSAMLEVLRQDFIRTARAKGVRNGA